MTTLARLRSALRAPLDVRAVVALAEQYSQPCGVVVDGELEIVRSAEQYDAIEATR